MAFKLSNLRLFSSTMNAKSRIFFIFLGLAGVGIAGYVGYHMLNGGVTTTGPSQVASAPSGLQSVPGSKLSPEYYRALAQANAQATEQAKMTGGSAVPTLINVPGQQSAFPSDQNCTVLCSDDANVNVASDISDLVRSGKMDQTDANSLLDLAKNNASVSQYAAALDELVRQGKLTPEQARQLLEKYKKQYANQMVASSAASMDSLIKSGQLPVDVAVQLLASQKVKKSVADYSAELNKFVQDGKISPQTRVQLLAQYTQQQAQERAKDGAAQLAALAKAGAITADVATDLAALQKRNVSATQYTAELQKLVDAGKLTPAARDKLLAQYQSYKLTGRPADILSDLVDQAKTPSQKQALKTEAQRLLDMQANNASVGDYANELKQAVQNGILTPEEAAGLLDAYQTSAVAAGGAAPTIDTNIPGAADFAKLQQRLQQQPQVTTGNNQQFAAAAAQAENDTLQKKQDRIQALETAMSNQAGLLLTAWQPSTMQHKGDSSASSTDNNKNVQQSGLVGALADKTGAAGATAKRPLIKAGSILFAVLDTAVDSDYPDSPVMATIIQGKLRGSKLLGKLAIVKDKDKVSLNFTLMDSEAWPTTKAITAFAIDPDTARTVLASNVDHHYISRYGAMMGSAFVSGYSSALQSSGGTATTGIFGTSKTNPALSPGQKLAVGIGQIGTSLNSTVTNYVNTPATVKVNSGVGLGILFMADVPE